MEKSKNNFNAMFAEQFEPLMDVELEEITGGMLKTFEDGSFLPISSWAFGDAGNGRMIG